MLAAGFADSPDFVERFRREALTAAALSHPNIAQVYDYGVDGDSHFIVMEYAEGQDLAHLIRRARPAHPRPTPSASPSRLRRARRRPPRRRRPP